jgi:hypothetical protein
MGVMLCIDGLPLDYSSKALRELAEVHGDVLRAWIVTQPGTHTSLRFGYVEAATSVGAQKMIERLTGAKLNCKLCTVDIETTG